MGAPQKSSPAPLLTNGQPAGPSTHAVGLPASNATQADVAGLTQNSDEFYVLDKDDNAAMHVDVTAAVIPSGRAVVMTEMKKNFDRLVVEPFCWFHNQYTYREEHIRIQRATLPQTLETNAENITKMVNADRALPPRNMRNLVRAEAHKINDGNEREIASLRTQIEKLHSKFGAESKQKSKKEKKKKKKDSPAADKKDFHCSRGKAVATGSANEHRGRAALGAESKQKSKKRKEEKEKES